MLSGHHTNILATANCEGRPAGSRVREQFGQLKRGYGSRAHRHRMHNWFQSLSLDEGNADVLTWHISRVYYEIGVRSYRRSGPGPVVNVLKNRQCHSVPPPLSVRSPPEPWISLWASFFSAGEDQLLSVWCQLRQGSESTTVPKHQYHNQSFLTKGYSKDHCGRSVFHCCRFDKPVDTRGSQHCSVDSGNTKN